MADTESLRQAVQSRAPLSTWLGVVLLLALFGAIVLAVVGPAPRGDDYEQNRAKAREEKLRILHQADAKELTTYGWIDKNKGVVRLPIDRGMDLALAELAKRQPAPAYPIATPAASVTPSGPAAGAQGPAPSAPPSGTPKIEGSKSENRKEPAAAPAVFSPSPVSSPAGAPRPARVKTSS